MGSSQSGQEQRLAKAIRAYSSRSIVHVLGLREHRYSPGGRITTEAPDRDRRVQGHRTPAGPLCGDPDSANTGSRASHANTLRRLSLGDKGRSCQDRGGKGVQ